jgi:diaminopimelate epimerase
MVVGRRSGQLDSSVKVQLRGGELTIDWQGEGEPVWMTGPVASVFEGEIDLAGL